MRLKRTSATTPDVISQGALVQRVFDMALGERKFRIWFGWDLDESKQSNQIENLSNQIRFDPRCHVLTVCPAFAFLFFPNLTNSFHRFTALSLMSMLLCTGETQKLVCERSGDMLI